MITSRANAWFKRVRKAIHDHDDEIVIEGPKAVNDAIAAGWKPVAIGVRRLAAAFQSSAGAPHSKPIEFSDELFRELADTKTSQGVIGLFTRPRWTSDQILGRRDSIAVALDGVQDPGNVGTIVRLAAAFDAGGVVLLPGCADAYGPKAVRASAGAILNVAIAEMTIDELLARGLPIFAADARGSSQVPNGVIVFGSEGQGISPRLRAVAKLVRIEMSNRVESLNVAAAAAILLSRTFHG